MPVPNYPFFMQKLYKKAETTTLAMHCEPAEEELADVLAFDLVIPDAALATALRQPVSTAALVVRQASITSTVPAKVCLQLRANNTALGAAWCTTATLAVPQSALRARA